MTRVEDGDSIDVEVDGGLLEVRLLGVNAPDRGECFADASRDFLSDAVLGKRVTIDVRGQDQFARALAVIRADGVDVNQSLVARGMALATTPRVGEGLTDEYVKAEESAYREAIGLWDPAACGPASAVEIEVDPSSSEPDPPGPDDDVLSMEGVTLINRGTAPADISGWILRDESSRHRHRFPSGTILAPGSSLFVASDEPGWSPGGSAVWNNGGDIALLLDQSGNVVARWRY